MCTLNHRVNDVYCPQNCRISHKTDEGKGNIYRLLCRFAPVRGRLRPIRRGRTIPRQFHGHYEKVIKFIITRVSNEELSRMLGPCSTRRNKFSFNNASSLMSLSTRPKQQQTKRFNVIHSIWSRDREPLCHGIRFGGNTIICCLVFERGSFLSKLMNRRCCSVSRSVQYVFQLEKARVGINDSRFRCCIAHV